MDVSLKLKAEQLAGDIASQAKGKMVSVHFRSNKMNRHRMPLRIIGSFEATITYANAQEREVKTRLG